MAMPSMTVGKLWAEPVILLSLLRSAQSMLYETNRRMPVLVWADAEKIHSAARQYATTIRSKNGKFTLVMLALSEINKSKRNCQFQNLAASGNFHLIISFIGD